MALTVAANPIVSPLTGRDTQAASTGVYFVAINPTAGTGIVGPVSTTFDEAKALMTVYNSSTTVTIYPLALALHVTVVGTTGTRQNFTHTIDDGNRYSSGGTALTTANTNSGSTTASAATITFGALVTTAASGSRRLLGNNQIREAAIEIVGDRYEWNFGGAQSQSGSRVATVADFHQSLPSVAIAPGDTWVLHHWRGAITVGVTFEANFSYLER